MSGDGATEDDLSVLIVSHGSSLDPDSYEPVYDCARRLRKKCRFGEVVVGFHKQSPGLREAWRSLESRRVAVIPFLASAGFFASRFIPKQLGFEAAHYDEVVDLGDRQIVYTAPVGVDRQVWSLVDEVAINAIDTILPPDLTPDQVTVLVVGHGTPRHRASGQSVRDCVAYLREQKARFGHVLEAFVDEEPFLDSVLERAPAGDIVVVPYFVANGPHVTEDIPQGLGIAGDPSDHPHRVGEHRFWFVDAIGLRAELCEIVAARARAAADKLGVSFGEDKDFEIRS